MDKIISLKFMEDTFYLLVSSEANFDKEMFLLAFALEEKEENKAVRANNDWWDYENSLAIVQRTIRRMGYDDICKIIPADDTIELLFQPT